jgi:GDP-4-dehydro-6-deoxy-D-mannose reductase
LGRGISQRLFVGHVYAEIEAYLAGRTAKISVGNLDSRRDYIAVEEAVRAYALIMQRGSPGEIYNVGSGVSIPIRALLQTILAENGLGMEIVEPLRPASSDKLDVSDIFADVSKLRSLVKG